MRRAAGRKRKGGKALKKEDAAAAAACCNSLPTAELDGHLTRQRAALPAPGSDGEEEEDEECEVDCVRPSQCSPGGQDRELHLFITVDDGAGAGADRTRAEEGGGPGVPSWDKDGEDGCGTDGWSPRSDSEPSDGDEEEEEDEFGQLDLDLERKSREHNLTSGNIRSILHEVITNEHVVAMMKAAIRETQDLPLFEPKMTRSRLKQVVAQGESVHSLNLSPIRGALAKAPQFVDIPLEEEEDSSDEEYCPDEDEDDETAEESFLSDVDSLGSSPRVPRGTPRQHHAPDETSHVDDTKRAGCSRQLLLRVDAADPTAAPPPPPPPPLPPPTPPPPSCSSSSAAAAALPSPLLLHSGPTDTAFLERLCAVEEELSLSTDCPNYQGLNEEDGGSGGGGGGGGLVALRTRSKRPLRDVPLGLLEAELRAPDITPDMYDATPPDLLLEEDRHWSRWLQGLMREDNDEEGDDDDDPEYNFLEDVDEPDKEDYRTDRAVRITKKEVNQLLEELFDTFQEETLLEEVEGEEEEDDSQQLVPKYHVPQALRFEAPLASMLTERRRVVREQYEAAQQKRALLDTPGHAPSKAAHPQPAPRPPHHHPRPPATLALDRSQKLRLQQQLQQHVQLLTQVHMLTQRVESLRYEASVTKDYLEELGQYARRQPAAASSNSQGAPLVEATSSSSFRVSNLQGALELLREEEEEAARRGQAASPVAPNNTTWLPKKRSCAFPQLPAAAAWLLATRGRVFLYPELLPARNLDPDKQRTAHKKTMYAQGEHCLIVLGLVHFEHTVLPVEQLCTYLVRKCRREVLRHIVDMCGPTGPPGNAIRVFHESGGVLPDMPAACSAAAQGEQRPPVDRDVSLLPNWLKKSQAAIHGARLPSGGYPRALPRNVTLRLHPALARKGRGLAAPPPRPTGIFALAHNSSLPPLASAGPVSHAQPTQEVLPETTATALPAQGGVVLLAESACSLAQEAPPPLGHGGAMSVPPTAQEPPVVSLAAVYPASSTPHHQGALHPPESSRSSLLGAAPAPPLPPGGRRTATCRKQPNRQARTSSKAAPVRSASRPKKTPAPCDHPRDGSTPPSPSPPASTRTPGGPRARADQSSGVARARASPGRSKARPSPRRPIRPIRPILPILPDLPEEECHPLSSSSSTATPPRLLATVSTVPPQAAQTSWIVRPVSGTTLNQTIWSPAVRPVSGATLNQASWTRAVTPVSAGATVNHAIWTPAVRPVSGTALKQTSWTQVVSPVSGTTLNQTSWTPAVRPVSGTTLNQTAVTPVSGTTLNQTAVSPVSGTTLNQTNWTQAVRPVSGTTLNQTAVRPVSGTTLNQTNWTQAVRPVSGTTLNQTAVRPVSGTAPNQTGWTQAVRPVSGTAPNQTGWTQPPVKAACAGVVPAAPNRAGDYVLVQIGDSSQVLWMRVEKKQSPDVPAAPPAPQSTSSQSTSSQSTSSQSTSSQSTSSQSTARSSSFEEQLHRLVEGLREEEEEPSGGEEEEEEGEGGLEGEGEAEEVTAEREEGSSTSESVTSRTPPPLHALEEEEEEMERRGGEQEAASALGSVTSSSYPDDEEEEEEVRDCVSTTSSSSDGDKVTENEGAEEGGEEGGGGGPGEEEESGGGGGGGDENGGGEERGGGGGEEPSGQGDGDAGGGGGGGGGGGDEEEGDAEGQSGGERDEDKDGEEEEEEDFDDLTQDEDEEEAMSSASEESVLSVPELQETMKKLTWLASEGRGGLGGDSEEDPGDSPEASPGSQEDLNSDLEEEKEEEEEEEEGEEEEELLLLVAAGQGGRGRSSKKTAAHQDEEEEGEESGEGTPSRRSREKGPGGRGRGRARPGLLRRRSRRRERHSKDTSKLLLLYDHNILDKDPLRDSKDTAFAQAYLTRVREALADAPGKMEEFLGLLYEHGQTAGGGRDGSGDAAQLFGRLRRGVLAEQPDLLRDFAAFLHPEQALQCGLFEEQQAFERSRRFLRQLEISFGENPSHYQKIIKALQGGVSLSQASVDELKSQMATLLKGHTHLQGEFWVFFDELRPPPARPGQFEEAHWPEEGGGGGSDGGEAVGGGGVAGGGAGGGGFEEVTLPDLEEEEEAGHNKIRPMAVVARRRRRKIGSVHGNYKECDWSDKDCSCPCHESGHDAKLRKHRRKGCPRCHGNKTSDSGVSRAMKSLDPLYSLSVSPTTANQPTEPGLEEEGPEEKDPELEEELKEEPDSDVNSPLPERGAASWEGAEEDAAAATSSSSLPPPPPPTGGGAGGKEDKAEETDEGERKRHGGGGGVGEAGSSPGAKRRREEEEAASPPGRRGGEASPPGAKRRRGGGGGEGGSDEEERHHASSSSCRTTSPPAADPTVPAKNMSLTPSGQKVILWTREADRVILTTCQQEGANQSTFQAISAQLANKTPSEVSQRFRDLMTLFHTAARQSNSEDEAPPAEPPSTNQEEEDDDDDAA